MNLDLYDATLCDKILALFSKPRRVYLENVNDVVMMKRRDKSFREISDVLGLPLLDIKNIYYKSLGLTYRTEIVILMPKEMSTLDSRLANILIRVGIDSKLKAMDFAVKSDDGWIDQLCKINGLGEKTSIDICKWFLLDLNRKFISNNKKCKFFDKEHRFLKDIINANVIPTGELDNDQEIA